MTLDVDPDLCAWPPGTDAPEAALFVRRDSPRSYRVFKYSRDADRSAFNLADRNWSELKSDAQWRRFLAHFTAFDRMAHEAQGVEAPDDGIISDDVAPPAPAGAA